MGSCSLIVGVDGLVGCHVGILLSFHFPPGFLIVEDDYSLMGGSTDVFLRVRIDWLSMSGALRPVGSATERTACCFRLWDSDGQLSFICVVVYSM